VLTLVPSSHRLPMEAEVISNILLIALFLSSNSPEVVNLCSLLE